MRLRSSLAIAVLCASAVAAPPLAADAAVRTGVLQHDVESRLYGMDKGPLHSVAQQHSAQGQAFFAARVPAPVVGPPLPAGSGSGRRIVYSNSQQRIWLVESSNVVSHSWLVSGKRNIPPAGTYHIQSRSVNSSSGSLRLPWMQRFYQTPHGGWVGFHGIPLRPNGTPIESDSQLGQPLSHGCVRMNQQAVKVVWDWAPLGTAVVVTP